jgi:hypothetical protein
MGVVVQTYIPSYSGSINQEDLSPGQPRHKARTYLKNNQCKKSWGCGSSSRAPAQQVQRPEFKLQYCQKKKKYQCTLSLSVAFINQQITWSCLL